jgi:mRNA-degrading endonuclease RelE of RelBE toxin-antitoxin system
MKISASVDFTEWLFSLPPHPKRRIRLSLRQLAKGIGDIKQLQGDLQGFCRLRVGGMRVIFRYRGPNEICLEYGNTRDVVYELFQQYLMR